MSYCIDTSAILDLWDRWYPPDIFPAVWKRIEDLIGNDKLSAPEDVRIELSKIDDDLFAWAQNRDPMFEQLDVPTQEAVREIISQYPGLAAERKGKQRADVFVIALAQIKGCIVVTGELPDVNPVTPRKMPDVCDALGIESMNITQVFREESWTF